MAQQCWIVTGANRGIGLEYVRQCLAKGLRVIATVRDPARARELRALAQAHPGQCRIEALDTGSGESIDDFAKRIAGEAVDVLVNNAGLYGGSWASDAARQSLEGMDYALWEEILRVNTIGPFRLTVALREALSRGERKLVVMMSSDLGSIADNTMGQSHAYRTSKAALNMVTRGLAIDLAGEGISVVSMAPGWTQTDLGGEAATWPVADSVARQLAVIETLGAKDSGQFVNLLGEPVAW
ncbi:SDR family oxidoreductase [Novosphingobium sp. YJ-S2-02]|uniref:SDR family oxidoreductase n=1 Tax=Novosphingobium aureum TaxID=2792964 RepID=A0A931HDF0_9SPHN|nr:SDR family oxidoreductase [Novosphingobium aureum]MBH0113369.1 SDR family oxidoreductase [Novosphingobium aureum]